MGCTPNLFQQFLLQGKTTIKRHVICSLFVVSTLWGRKTIFIPGLRAKVHGCFYIIKRKHFISLLTDSKILLIEVSLYVESNERLGEKKCS